MLYNYPKNVAPTTPFARAKPRFISTGCDEVKNDDWVTYYVVRYPSIANANADTTRDYTLELADRVYHDTEDLVAGLTYAYRWFWKDIYGNLSDLSTTVSAVSKVTSITDVD